MLSAIVDILADPADGSPLTPRDDFTRLESASGHSFDVAKQGYVALFSGARRFDGDTLEMVRAREAFLSRGHYAPFVEAVSDAVHDALHDADVPQEADVVLAEVGAGTGFYLSHTLDDVTGSRGVGIDISVPAAKKLAKAHPRMGAVVADVWERLPLESASIDVLTVIFAPRNPAEFARVLKDGGEVIVLMAAPGHLGELREPLGILDVEAGKIDRLREQAAGHLVVSGEPELVEFTMHLDRESIGTQVGMSPSIRHIDPAELARRVADLPDSMTVTARGHLVRLAKA